MPSWNSIIARSLFLYNNDSYQLTWYRQPPVWKPNLTKIKVEDTVNLFGSEISLFCASCLVCLRYSMLNQYLSVSINLYSLTGFVCYLSFLYFYLLFFVYCFHLFFLSMTFCMLHQILTSIHIPSIILTPHSSPSNQPLLLAPTK